MYCRRSIGATPRSGWRPAMWTGSLTAIEQSLAAAVDTPLEQGMSLRVRAALWPPRAVRGRGGCPGAPSGAASARRPRCEAARTQLAWARLHLAQGNAAASQPLLDRGRRVLRATGPRSVICKKHGLQGGTHEHLEPTTTASPCGRTGRFHRVDPGAAGGLVSGLATARRFGL